jgi:CheY-like chemotaxis protein
MEDNNNATQHAVGPTVLVVDNDPLMLRLVSEMLKLGGYCALEADGPERALRVFDRNLEMIDLVLSDLTMPGMNGRELSARLCTRKPGLPVVFMSGDNPAEDANLHKPFGIDELHLRVAQALQARY